MYTIQELAQFMKVSERTIYRMIKKVDGPKPIRFGGSWRFSTDEVDRFVSQQVKE